MSEAALQERIDALPKEHKPRPYRVVITDKKGAYLSTRYVRASSPERAKLTGFKVAKYTFNQRKAFSSNSAPEGWSADSN